MREEKKGKKRVESRQGRENEINETNSSQKTAGQGETHQG